MSKRMSWHQSPEDTDYEYKIFQHYLMLPYTSMRGKKRDVKAAFHKYCEEKGNVVTNPPKFIYDKSRANAWKERAANYDAHMAIKIQEGEDRGIMKVASKRAEERAETMAMNVSRMRAEWADFVDEVGPELKEEVLTRLRERGETISDNALAQYLRLVLDATKVLDRGEGEDDDDTMTDQELQAFLDKESATEGP